MQAKVVLTEGRYRLVLPGGESVSLDPRAIPESLSHGGDCRMAIVPAGESAPDEHTRAVLNQLLGAA